MRSKLIKAAEQFFGTPDGYQVEGGELEPTFTEAMDGVWSRSKEILIFAVIVAVIGLIIKII